jgi:hypothetical protein
VRIDHVIYAAADLDAATARIEDELGLTAVGGGRHEGHGTRNRIVPLGGGYLEVLAIADPREASTSEFGSGLLTRLARDGEGWPGSSPCKTSSPSRRGSGRRSRPSGARA